MTKTQHNVQDINNWKTLSYTVRHPGRTCWLDGIKTWAKAEKEQRVANDVMPGHSIYAEQEYVGELESMHGQTRTVVLY